MKLSVANYYELFFVLRFGNGIQQHIVQTTSLVMSRVFGFYLAQVGTHKGRNGLPAR